ncbi:MAG: DUF362 domain-containing protein [Spirochaetes bacterium]|nr:DUF362 domain-containing protein [Spirochaetota bacterium]
MSEVYFINLRKINKSVLNYIDNAFDKIKYNIIKDSIVACKVHFGELGNTSYIRPVFIRRIVENIKNKGGKVFLTDTNTLYRGARTNAVDFLNSAIYNGFGYDSTGVPIIIADGLRSNNRVEINTEDSKFFKKIWIAGDIYNSDEIVVVSHIKGHIAAGFGGAIKNICMGFAPRSTKQQMHGDVKPTLNKEKCIGCGLCIKYCPSGAISFQVVDGKKIANFNYESCIGCADCIVVCKKGALRILWNESIERFLEKMGEVTYYYIKELNKKILYINFIVDITPNCDCMDFSEYPLASDVGILFSYDPVAIDKASVDILKEFSGKDVFIEFRKNIDYYKLIDYCYKKGIGDISYKIYEI